MTCDQVVEMLTAYCDGELPIEASELVRHHVTTCAACAATLEEFQVATGLLQGLFSTIAAPASIESTVVSRIEEMVQQRHSSRMAIASVVNSLLLVTVVLLTVFSPAGAFIWSVARVAFKVFRSVYSLLFAAVAYQSWLIAGIVAVVAFVFAAGTAVSIRRLMGKVVV